MRARVYADENAVPILGPQKPTFGGQRMIHQRNKSSPALSSMIHAGNMKAAAKRTAFGDVSNTANGSRPSKDDSVLGVKAEDYVTEKPILVVQDKKTTALLRPAQRPMTVSGLKGLLNTVTNSNNQTTKQPLVESQQLIQPISHAANTRKALTKLSTAIFKDQAVIPAEHPIPTLQKQLISTASLAPVHGGLLPQPQPSLPKVQDEPQVKSKRTESRGEVEPEPKEHSAERSSVPESFEDTTALRSDGIYIDDQGEVQVYQFMDGNGYPEDQAIVSDNGVALPAEVKQNMAHAQLDRLLEAQLKQAELVPVHKHKLAPLLEPEEYWDEEDEEGNYDEEGYVTARSYKSRGDNTTSGATTVLFPKQNQKVKKELAAAKDLIEGSRTKEEIEDETWDTTMVAEYGDEIFQYMRDLEVRVDHFHGRIVTDWLLQIKMLPNAHYMDNQAEIQWSMRSVLMDWLVQVHHRFGLLPETLFLCVNYIDRFLSCKIVSLGKLQLVGATAIFVAAKYEEINCPSVSEIVYMVDSGYTVDEILKAERFMLSMLQFELGWPGPMSFLRRISKADDYDLETRTLAKYFLEITIMDERFVGSPPSFAAAGAHCLARMMLKKGHWVSDPVNAHICVHNKLI